MKSAFLRSWLFLVVPTFFLAGCATKAPPIPPAPAASAGSPAEASALFQACLNAHGGATAYARLHDVNVRFDSHWSSVGPKLQPKLSDTGYREGSEERYLATGKGSFTVGQDHHGPKGEKFVTRTPDGIAVWYNGQASGDEEALAAASLVADAYSMFLFGPEFFARRHPALQKLPEGGDVDGVACDRLLAVLRPGIGRKEDPNRIFHGPFLEFPNAPLPKEEGEDRVVLFIDRQSRLLRRVSFTLNTLKSTQGAEVHVDLSEHQRLAGVLFPTRFYEHIDRPVNLDAHRWQLLGFDVNRGYAAADLAGPVFRGKAAAPARNR